jgi:hypothetical protein
MSLTTTKKGNFSFYLFVLYVFIYRYTYFDQIWHDDRGSSLERLQRETLEKLGNPSEQNSYSSKSIPSSVCINF